VDELKHLKCVPCRGGEPSLDDNDIQAYRPQVPEWDVIEVEGVKRLQRQFKFKDFAQALAFTDQVGALAEAEDHHPVILTEWGRVTVTWWTHKIKGLHRNDFIMAAKTDQIASAQS
jgi:4a-hydroxytetrahydrobiopterin dehydratase